MKLRNKKTGKIVRVEFLSNWQTDDGTEIGFRECNTNVVYSYNSLAELNAEWEDYEEPKDFWSITMYGGRTHVNQVNEPNISDLEEIGNCFNTKEDAEDAIDKLKAWKRLRHKGFRFTEWYNPDGCEPFIVIETNLDNDDVENKELEKDLDLLFGGENENTCM